MAESAVLFGDELPETKRESVSAGSGGMLTSEPTFKRLGSVILGLELARNLAYFVSP